MENQLFFITIFVSLLLVFLIEAWRKSRSKYAAANLPPGPWKLPIVGNLHQLVGSLPHRRLADLAKKHGPIMHLKFGQLSTLVISSPELAEEVMKTQDLIFASRPSSLAIRILTYNAGDVVLSPYGDHWRQMKKICVLELFNGNRVQSFRSIREEFVSNLIKSVASNARSPVNLSKMLTTFSYSIISRITFGEVHHEEAFTPIVRKIASALAGLSIVDIFPFIKPLEGIISGISGMRSELEKLHGQVDAILEVIIREHRERNTSEMEANDVLSALLNFQDRGVQDVPLTMQDIKAILLDMFIGGTESSATVIEWAISEMVKHPDTLRKAQAEVRKVFHGKEKIDEKSLNDLLYLNCVIKETFRLHPPGPLIPRESREMADISSYKIPEKTRIIINAWAIGRDPHHWTDPEKFSPERFLNRSIDYKGTNYELIPFGSGRRICPAILYSKSIFELTLANLLYHFDWKVPSGLNPEDFDMSESFGVAIRRKDDLCLIPIPFSPEVK